MTTINLKDFYPWYTRDEYIEVCEEVADELRASRLYEAAYQRRIVRNKAQYSLDCEDGIEYSACVSEPTPRRSCWSAWSCSAICALRSILCRKRRAAGWTPV